VGVNICVTIFVASEISTTLYPHQKKALTFLLEREREQKDADGNFPSLWQERRNPVTRQKSWVNVVTQKEVFKQPNEPKGAILADDVSGKNSKLSFF